MQIQIKPVISDWKKVDRQQAKKFVEFLINNITAMKSNDAIKYINEERIRGITVEELL